MTSLRAIQRRREQRRLELKGLLPMKRVRPPRGAIPVMEPEPETHGERLARLKDRNQRCGCMERAVVWTESERALCARCANRRVKV